MRRLSRVRQSPRSQAQPVNYDFRVRVIYVLSVRLSECTCCPRPGRASHDCCVGVLINLPGARALKRSRDDPLAPLFGKSAPRLRRPCAPVWLCASRGTPASFQPHPHTHTALTLTIRPLDCPRLLLSHGRCSFELKHTWERLARDGPESPDH